MTAAQSAEAQARLNVNLKDIVTFYEENGVLEHSINLMNSFIEKHLTMDFLELAEGYGKCMAFIDHDELASRLLKSYNSLLDGYIIERKMINKRIRMLKEDKKADPEVLARQENLLAELDIKKANAIVAMARLRVMNIISIKDFQDEKLDAVDKYQKYMEHQKALLKAGKK